MADRNSHTIDDFLPRKMIRDRNILRCALLTALLAGSVLLIFNAGSSAQENDLRYKQFVPVRDRERRCERLGSATDDKQIDTTAFNELPEPYSAVVSEYIESVFSAIKAAPVTRRRFFHQEIDPTSETHPYPDGKRLIADRDVTVPLVILPRPDVVRQWSASAEARSSGWVTEGEAAENRGSVYGRTLIFTPGRLSEDPVTVPASPFESWIRSWDLYVMHDRTFFMKLGKLVVTPSYYSAGDKGADLHIGRPKDKGAPLQLGEKGGAELVGELITVPAHLRNQRLRWVSIRKSANARRFLAYSLLDGNGVKRKWDGVKREWRFQETPLGPISPYVRPLICDRHQPRIKQHDELLLPAPSRWAPTEWEYKDGDYSPHEEWCFDDWFPAQKEACWVIREAEGSSPLQESFLLMPATERSDRPVFFIALFAETEPKQLVHELAALYNVPAGNALDSPETMERLNSRYEKVRTFSLGK